MCGTGKFQNREVRDLCQQRGCRWPLSFRNLCHPFQKHTNTFLLPIRFFLMSCFCLLVDDSLSFELTSFVKSKHMSKREDKGKDVTGTRREGGADSGGN